MSIVQPIPQQTEIWCYRDIPWDNSYKDIRLFNSQLERNTFLEKHKVNPVPLINFSVVRPGQAIRVTGRLNDWIWVTYMSFQNNGLTVEPTAIDLRYYCFVTEVNYINVNCVELVYEIDWIQTYLFAFRLGACLVEREHVNDDTEGLWLADEHIETGEYVLRTGEYITFEPAVFAWILLEELGQGYVTRLYNNTATPCLIKGYTLDNLSELDEDIKTVSKEPEGLPMLCMGVANMISEDDTHVATSFTMQHVTNRKKGFGNYGNDGYIARNNKLNCYPYCVLSIDNFMGDIEQLHWEEFHTSTSIVRWWIDGVVNPKPCIAIQPQEYKGQGGGTSPIGGISKQFRLEYSNFPLVPFAMDTYKRWVSTEAFPAVVSVAASIASSSISPMGVIGGINGVRSIGNIAGATSTAVNLMKEDKAHALSNTQYHGGVGSSGMQYLNKEIGFRVLQYAIREEVARRIDTFFDRYGYRVDVVKVPNIRGRRHVNYVKTNGAEVHGIAPQIAKETFARALDNGVSFWHIDEIGEPMADNPIMSV